MWNRDFEPDSSSSSFDDDLPGTPPGHVNPGFDDEFKIDTNPYSTNPQGIKAHHEKVGFMDFNPPSNYYPQAAYPEQPPPARPPSSQAQMRAKMNEANRAKLLSRGGGAIAVVPKEDLFGKPGDSSLNSILYPNQILKNSDLHNMKDFKGLAASDHNFQPSSLGYRDASMPKPIKADPTTFNDDLQEVVLGEGSKNEPSQKLANFMNAPREEVDKGPKPAVIEQTYLSKPVPAVQTPPAPIQNLPVPKPAAIQSPPTRPTPPQQAEPVVKQPTVVKEERKAPEPVRAERPQETKTEDSKENPRRPIVNAKEVILKAMVDMRRFLTAPAPRDIMVQCTIRREKAGFARLYPKYFMHLSDGWEFVLAAKKRGGNKTSNYLITMSQKEFSKSSQHYLAKVRSNFMGTEFHTYDSGLNPKDKKANNMNTREELMIITYQSNILGTKGPRKMRVVIPFVSQANDRHIWKPMNVRIKQKEEGLLENFKKGNTNGMHSFYNKPPKWSEHVQAFVLNFNGRVDRASVKNFQLIDDNDDSKVYLQFGRVGDQHFNVDFQWPFSPIQAFAVALTSFDNKFACEQAYSWAFVLKLG